MTQTDFENLLHQTMGLDVASIGSTTIERAVRQRMASMGLAQLEDYWRQLWGSTEELQELIETVVVPETWFFRDPEAFGALLHIVMEEWRPNHPAGILRLLSIPCCTGEEPYSMIMALLDGGFSLEQLHVDAVDISTRALARARRGVYGTNSFRGANVSFRERYFHRAANGYIVAERLSRKVNFRRGNLLSSGFPLGEEPYHVIFCRNLLIYFDRSTQDRAMKILKSLLAPDGFLFVGSAEAFLAACSGFTSVNRAMAFAFRRAGAKRVEAAEPAARGSRKLARKHPGSPAKCPPKPDLARVSMPVQPAPAAVDLETARRLADTGRLREAAEQCETHLRQRGPSTEAYYLLALVSDAIGDRQRAAECYRRVLYLEPGHADALMHLALLSDGQGDATAARRLRERARRAERSV